MRPEQSMTIDLLEKWIALMADEISEKEAA